MVDWEDAMKEVRDWIILRKVLKVQEREENGFLSLGEKQLLMKIRI
jgi:hypothetical protein